MQDCVRKAAPPSVSRPGRALDQRGIGAYLRRPAPLRRTAAAWPVSAIGSRAVVRRPSPRRKHVLSAVATHAPAGAPRAGARSPASVPGGGTLAAKDL